MNSWRALGIIFLCLIVTLFVISEVRATNDTHNALNVPSQLTVNAAISQIGVNSSSLGLGLAAVIIIVAIILIWLIPEEKPRKTDASIINPILAPPPPAPEPAPMQISIPESTIPESTIPESTIPESTIPESTIPESTIPESTPPPTPPPISTTHEKQEIALTKNLITRIKNLEEEKKKLLLEIYELRKMVNKKTAELENEVFELGALRDKFKSLNDLM